MTIPYCVQIADLKAEGTAVEAILLSTFKEIDTIYNNWNPESEISQLNCLPAGKKIKISPPLYAFLVYVDSMVKYTEGRFDPTIEPLQQIWKKYLKEGQIPPSSVLAELQAAVGWEKIHLENGFFWKEHAATAIDLGGIAKGYAVDLISERLQAAGYKNVYVEWGGEIRTLGHRAVKKPWKIGIIGQSSIELADGAVATSGSYIQNWTVDSISYSHIIDPRTKQPLTNSPISSVTVCAPTCAAADALATALMLFPSLTEAKSWAQEKNLHIYIW